MTTPTMQEQRAIQLKCWMMKTERLDKCSCWKMSKPYATHATHGRPWIHGGDSGTTSLHLETSIWPKMTLAQIKSVVFLHQHNHCQHLYHYSHGCRNPPTSIHHLKHQLPPTRLDTYPSFVQARAPLSPWSNWYHKDLHV